MNRSFEPDMHPSEHRPPNPRRLTHALGGCGRGGPRRRVAGAALIAAALALTGCTGGGSSAPTPSVTGPSFTPTTATASNATSSLSKVKCSHHSSGWSFTGQIENGTKQTADYTVLVRIADKSNKNATLGLTTLRKTVPAGQTVSYAAQQFSKLGSSGHVCIATATRG